MRIRIQRFVCFMIVLNVFFGCGLWIEPATAAETGPTTLINDVFTQYAEGTTAASLGYTLTAPASGSGGAAVATEPNGNGKGLYLNVNNGSSSSTTKVSRTFTPQTGVVDVEMSYMQPGSAMLTSTVLNLYSSTGKFVARINTNPSIKAITYVPQSANTTILPYNLNTWYNVKAEINVQSQKVNVWINGVLYLSRVAPVDTGVTDIAKIEFVTPTNNGSQYIGNLKVTASAANFPPDAPTGLFYVPRDKEIAIWWNSVTSAVYYNVKAKVAPDDPWTVTKYTKNFFPMERTSVKSVKGVPVVNGNKYYVGVSQVTKDLNGNFYESSETVIEAIPLDKIAVPSDSSNVIGNLTVFDAYYASKWSVNPGLHLGDNPFSESAYTITSLPAQYGNLDWIEPDINSQKYTDKAQIATFNVRDNASVYIAMDQRATLPAWLSGWTDTRDAIQLNDGAYALEIYKKDFTANSLVTLGLNTAAQANSGNIGYFVLAGRQPVGLTVDPLKPWVNTPVLTVTGSVYENDVTLSVYNNQSLAYSGQLGEKQFRADVQLTPGPNNIQIKAKRAGASLSDSFTATVHYDPEPPAVTIATPPSSVKDAVYMLQGSVNEDANITIKNNNVILFDHVALTANQPFLFPLQFIEGSNHIEISAVDLAGNISTTDYSINYTFWAGRPDFYDLDGHPLRALAPSSDVIASKQITNTTSNFKQVELIIVMYNAEHAMVDYASVTAGFEPGETRTISTGFTLPEQVTGAKLKAFIWDSLNGLKPLSDESLLQ